MSQLGLEMIRQRLVRLAELDLLPDWVKQAESAQVLSPPKTLPRHMYADPDKGEFPCHTKAAVATSYGLYLFDAPTMPAKQAMAIEANFQTLGRHFGVSNTLRQLRQGFEAAQQKQAQAEPDDVFAVVRRHSDGRVERHYPLRNAKETRAAAVWLYDRAQELPFADRRVIATKIAQAADRYGAALGELDIFIEKAAGNGWCSPKEAAALVSSRIPYVKSAEVGEKLQTLSDQIRNSGAFCASRDGLAKLAALVEDVDRANQLVELYGQTLKRPEELFHITYKQASELVDTSCVLVTGTTYSNQQFEKLAYRDVADLFGEDFALQVSNGLDISGEKMAEIAATLPLPDARLLEQLMSSVNETPLMKDANAHRVHFSPAELAVLAAAGN